MYVKEQIKQGANFRRLAPPVSKTIIAMKNLNLLRFISAAFEVDRTTSVNFNTLAFDTGLSKEDLDNGLNQLERERFIDQFVIDSNYFLLRLKTKSLIS